MDTDIRLGVANLICFPVSHVYFFVGGSAGAKVNSQTWWGAMAGFSPLWIYHCPTRCPCITGYVAEGRQL